ncbi:MAG: BRO family protein [Sulfuricella sp.]
MTNKQLPAIGSMTFEELKQANEHGAEYWSARDLQPMLGYSQWRRFEDAVKRAMTSCETSGNNPAHHFAGAGKMVELGSGSQRQLEDYQLSRFACYLIAQNGDPRKPEIAQAQKYFAIQARRQELSDQATADMERLELRKQTSEEFKALAGARTDSTGRAHQGSRKAAEKHHTKARVGYQPDFVAETTDTIYMLEPKKRTELEDPVVIAKKEAAAKWCANASNHAASYGGKPWRYILIPHDEIADNITLAGLAARFGG